MKLLCTFVAVVCTGVLASSAAAVPPEGQTIKIDETFTIPAGEACDFPVEVRTVGKLKVADFFNQDGSLKFHAENPSLVDTISNPLNGKSLTSHDRGLDKFTVNDDGTITLLSTAIHFQQVVPGEGLVFADISLRVITFDEDFNVISFEVKGGRVDGDIIDYVCAALA